MGAALARFANTAEEILRFPHLDGQTGGHKHVPEQPKLYTELSDWWQLVSPTEDYADEAAFFASLFRAGNVGTVLELGCGGGNVAWFLKKDFALTLTDLSSAMLAESEKQNPELEHIEGDMRTLRLGRTFDGVLIHDAIMYMTSEQDLRAALLTAYEHCEPGGVR